MAKREMYLQVRQNKIDASMLDIVSNRFTLEAIVNKDFLDSLGQDAAYVLEDKGYVNITITMSSLQ